MRYYPKGTKVIANCGVDANSLETEWIPGEVLEREFKPYLGERHLVKLERRDSDGKDIYYFTVGLLVEDNPRNRRKRGLKPQEQNS